MKILAFAMQKGSVGKTTTTLAVGVELAKLGHGVLRVDIDSQSNLTQALRYDPTQMAHSLRSSILQRMSSALRRARQPRRTQIPASRSSAKLDRLVGRRTARAAFNPA